MKIKKKEIPLRIRRKTNSLIINICKQIQKEYNCRNRIPEICWCFIRDYNLKKYDERERKDYIYFKYIFTT